MLPRIEQQIERFAPGFSKRVHSPVPSRTPPTSNGATRIRGRSHRRRRDGSLAGVAGLHARCRPFRATRIDPVSALRCD